MLVLYYSTNISWLTSDTKNDQHSIRSYPSLEVEGSSSVRIASIF